MRILEGRAAENYVRKLERRGQTLDALEPRVRRIVQRVRRDGATALRRYAESWTGLEAGGALRVSDREMQSELTSSWRALRYSLGQGAGALRTCS